MPLSENFPRRYYPDRVRGYLSAPQPRGAPLFQLNDSTTAGRPMANCAQGDLPQAETRLADSQIEIPLAALRGESLPVVECGLFSRAYLRLLRG
jgi:hypothetical protein